MTMEDNETVFQLFEPDWAGDIALAAQIFADFLEERGENEFAARVRACGGDEAKLQAVLDVEAALPRSDR